MENNDNIKEFIEQVSKGQMNCIDIARRALIEQQGKPIVD